MINNNINDKKKEKKMTKQARNNTIWFNKKANIQFVKIGQVKRYSKVNIPKTYKQRTYVQFEVSTTLFTLKL